MDPAPKTSANPAPETSGPRIGSKAYGRRLVLHISDRVLELVAAKLEADYGWESDMVEAALDWILDISVLTDGSCSPPQPPALVPGLNDREDLHQGDNLPNVRVRGRVLLR